MTTASAETIIDAPAALVWQTVLDLDRYPEWNPFTPRIACDGGVRVGAAIDIEVRWGNGKPGRSHERIARLEPLKTAADGVVRGVYGYKLRGAVAALNVIRSERQQIVEQLADGRTRYRTWIRVSGLLGRLAPAAAIQDGFDRQTAALRLRCEALAGRG